MILFSLRLFSSLFFYFAFLFLSPPISADEVSQNSGYRFVFDPEIGIAVGSFSRGSFQTTIAGQGAIKGGVVWEEYFLGVEVFPKYFELDWNDGHFNFTSVPIGLFLKRRVSEKLKIFFSWYWDDVLYKDFYLKFQSGFRIPKDYDWAFEGPGSWRMGFAHRISESLWLNHSVVLEKFASFKRRHPTEVIGDLNPVIEMLTYSLTLSWSY